MILQDGQRYVDEESKLDIDNLVNKAIDETEIVTL